MAEQVLPREEALVGAGADPVPTARRQLAAQEWRAIEQDPDFQELVREKRSFIVPATVIFIVYYFALPILVGYVPDFMDTKLIGYINLAYLFALSQFVMAWVIMALYVRRAGGFDALAARVVAKVKGGRP